jgi:hypothetical protein
MMANIQMIKKMALVFSPGLMVKNIQDSGRMDCNMGMENLP